MLAWLTHYRRAQLGGDLGAGVIVALMLIPQGMAYALVAGLPPVAGLYASVLPPFAYALFGSSMVQSVGPMAITSLMIGAALVPLAPAGSALAVTLAGQMALIVGLALLLCGVLRLGFLSNFLSRPVMSGFTSGAAILIAFDQLGTLLGGPPGAINPSSAALGVGALALLWAAKHSLTRLLVALGMRAAWADTCAKLAPVAVVVGATALVAALGLEQWGVQVIGKVPAGFPALGLHLGGASWKALLTPSLLIAFMVFLSGQSAAQALAQKRGERIDTNHELLGLGAANLASAVSGGFAVTGSISRSAVNYTAGANTPLATLISAALLALVLQLPNAGLALLPLPALAATIILAVAGMVDLAALRDAWRYDRADAMSLAVTAIGVLGLGVEEGVVLGVVLSLGTLIWRTSRPHMAELGRIAGSEHFRNIERYQADTLPDVLMLRIDAGLFFGNAENVLGHIENMLQQRGARGLRTRHVLLVMSAMNLVDTTGLYALGELNKTLVQRGAQLHLSEVKGPIMDRLKDSDFVLHQLSGKIFLSTAQAWDFMSGTDQPSIRGA